MDVLWTTAAFVLFSLCVATVAIHIIQKHYGTALVNAAIAGVNLAVGLMALCRYLESLK